MVGTRPQACELGAQHPENGSACADRAGLSLQIHVEDAIAIAGVGRFQHRVSLLCGLGVSGDGMEKAALMYIMRGVSQEWHVTGEALGMLGAASGLGQAVGAYAFGYLSDRHGRRRSLLWALTSVFSMGALCAASPTYTLFVFLRFLINIGLGGALPCAFTLLTEVVPVSQRSRWIPFLYSTYGLGRWLTALTAWALLSLSWRMYMLAIALPSGSLLLLQRWLPETPQFLVCSGRTQEARDLIDSIAFTNGVESPLHASTRLHADNVSKGPSESWSSAIPTGRNMLLCPMWLFVAFGTEWYNWILKILAKSNVPDSLAYRGLVIFNTNELIVPLLFGFLPTSIKNNRSVICTFCLTAALSLIGFALASAWNAPAGVVLAMSILASYCGVAVWVLFYTVTPSFFPAETRGTGFGICMMCNRLGYIVGPLLAAGAVESNKVLPLVGCATSYVLIAVLALFITVPTATDANSSPVEYVKTAAQPYSEVDQNCETDRM